MTLKPIYNNPLFIFHAAKEFFENGTLYASKYFRADKVASFDTMIHPKLCVPATNISFSLELVFKAFLMQDGIPVKGHNLHNLYHLLKSDVKKEIFDHYKIHDHYVNFITINLVHGDGTSTGKMEQHLSPEITEKFILSLLKTHALAFVNFRYLYDNKSQKERSFHFREFSNFTFSALSVLGKTLNLDVVYTKKKKSD